MKIARISPTTTARNSTPSKTRHSEKRDCVLDFRVLDFRFPNNNSPIPSPNNVTGSAHTASVNHSPALLGWRGQDITSRLNAAIPLNARYQAMKRRSLMKSAGCRVDSTAHQCAFSQFGPKPTSASSGTLSCAMSAIMRGTSVRTHSTSDSGSSNTSSSCTCMIIWMPGLCASSSF